MEQLTPIEFQRYNRHIILSEVGVKGQTVLRNSSVLVIGAGGLGSPVLLYLAAAGIGRIGIVDYDTVDESNLQRQVLHGSAMVGRHKTESAKNRLFDLNPFCTVEAHTGAITEANARELIRKYDLVIDGSDNFETRYLVNDASFLERKPLVFGSIFRFEGQMSVFNYQNGPCYRCLYPEAPPANLIQSCAEGGVLGVLPGVIGSLQANEAIKILLGWGDVASGRIIHFDSMETRFREMKLRKNVHCKLCSDKPEINELQHYQISCEPHEELGVHNQYNMSIEAIIERLVNGEEFIFIDVRKDIHDPIHLPNYKNIPYTEVGTLKERIDPEALTVLVCKTGLLSLRMAEYLQSEGFSHVYSMAGGAMRWNRVRKEEN